MKPIPVLQGEEIVVPVEGGYVRRAAPFDGFAVGDEFVTANEFTSALIELRERQEKRPTARWTRRRR